MLLHRVFFPVSVTLPTPVAICPMEPPPLLSLPPAATFNAPWPACPTTRLPVLVHVEGVPAAAPLPTPVTVTVPTPPLDRPTTPEPLVT
ncbi:hypothetical protein D3C72_1909010 [compost metagenome]